MRTSRTIHHLAAISCAAALLVGCAGDDPVADAPVESRAPAPSDSAPTSGAPGDTAPLGTAPLETAPAPTTPTPTPTASSGEMEKFRADVASGCSAGAAALARLPGNDGTAATAKAQIEILRGGSGDVSNISSPASLVPQFDEIVALSATADMALTEAEAAVAAADVATAQRHIDRHIGDAARIAARFAIMGATCGPADAERAAGADLNVPLELGAEQINVGFGSVWVSEQFGQVVRIDPVSGDVLARIDVGEGALKLQPADGRMWVRTRDAFVRIDPTTNKVDARLAKADVGPSTNRNWAVDGAMWVCDGRQLHRYDPTVVERIATVPIDIDCDFVLATPELVIAWTYNDDPSLSADPAAVMIDPATNGVLATVALPVDVLMPAILEDRVFFAGNGNSTAVVVDRATWTVVSTHELGRITGGGGIVTDGESIFVPTHDALPNDVLVVDAETYQVVDTIEPLDVNGVALLDGSLWVTHQTFDVAQKFDLGE